MSDKIQPAIIKLEAGQYLGDYLKARNESLPSGLIDKKYTGIGATTAEIMDAKRNSIIVCPTRALAATKTISARKDFEKKGITNIKIHYVGGPWVGVVPVNFSFILNEIKADKKVKIAVVADSLPKVIKKLGPETINSFHLLLDEIDSYQSEASYRPNLQVVVDYYKKFDAKSRTMISATVDRFSDPVLQAEPVTKIIIDSLEKPRIDAVSCQREIFASLTNSIAIAKGRFPTSKIIGLYSIDAFGVVE